MATGGPAFGQMRGLMVSEDRLLSRTEPTVGKIGRERIWGAMTPNFYGGTKRTFDGNDMVSSLVKMARGATVDGPEARIQPSELENETVRIRRHLALNPDLPTSGNNLQYFPVWVRSAIDPYVGDSRVPSDEDYMRSLLVEDKYGRRTRGDPNSMSVGGRARKGMRVDYKYHHATVATLNHMLQSREMKEDDTDQEFEEVLRDWKLDGVVNNQTTNMNLYGEDIGTGEDSDASVEIKGPSHIINYWGNPAVKGKRLYFIVKRVDRSKLPPRYLPGLNDDRVSLEGDFATSGYKSIGTAQANREGLVDRPFQIIPYVGYGAPPDRELAYIDSYGIPREGTYIYIGLVETGSSRIINHEYKMQAPYNDRSANQLPRIMIHFGLR